MVQGNLENNQCKEEKIEIIATHSPQPNNGKLFIDATVAPQYITVPTDFENCSIPLVKKRNDSNISSTINLFTKKNHEPIAMLQRKIF